MKYIFAMLAVLVSFSVNAKPSCEAQAKFAEAIVMDKVKGVSINQELASHQLKVKKLNLEEENSIYWLYKWYDNSAQAKFDTIHECHRAKPVFTLYK